MSRAAYGLTVWLMATACGMASAQEASITAADAKKFVGKEQTVCGVVASTNYLKSSRTQPTFLNLDKAYPNTIFTVVIFGSDRSKFGEPDVALKDRTICATGKIELYRDSPQIVVKDPKQLVVR